MRLIVVQWWRWTWNRPRSLVNAAKVGKVREGDYRAGLRLAFTNRLSTVDRLTIDGMAQRICGWVVVCV